MSKLDELGKKEFGFKELAHILWNADTEYDLQQMLEFHVAIVKNRVAREARLEEREAMKKTLQGMLNPEYEDGKYNLAVKDMLNELNKN